MRTSAALTYVRQGSRAASPVAPAPLERREMAGVALAPPPLMQPVRTGLFRRKKTAEGGKPPKPPGPKTGLTPPGKPHVPCDKCHVAIATHEIEVDASLRLYLFMCTHHVREMWKDFVARGYRIRKL